MDVLKPFQFHGVNYKSIPQTGQAKGDCPFCEMDGHAPDAVHFFTNVETGQWDCKRCGRTGNVIVFLEEILAYHLQTTTKKDWFRLRALRKNVVPSDQYKKHDFAWDAYKQRWLFPVRTANGRVCDLRVYAEQGHIYGSAGCKTGLWGAERLILPENATKKVFVAEGEWDGVAADWWLEKEQPGKWVVVAVPGANVFKKEWHDYFNGRPVVLGYDADKTGDEGMRKVGTGDQATPGALAHSTRSLEYVRWPLDVKDGYDVSDLLAEKQSAKSLLKLIADAPRTEKLKSRVITKKQAKAQKNGKPVTFAEVMTAYRNWLEMDEHSVMALRVMFSTILSNLMTGNDPLWFYIVAPPGSGKTALLNPLRSVPELCVFRSSLTTHMLVSGFQTNTDPSLIPKLFGKTLVLKDMTEILSAPQHVQEEIFGTLRGGYDGLVERSYGNGVYRKYEGFWSMLSGVTVAIHGHSKATMGERTLKFQLVPYRKTNHESVILKAMRNVGLELEMDEALGEITQQFLEQQRVVPSRKEHISGETEDRILSLAQIIAKLRTEVERDYRGETVKFRPQDEVASRLGKQLTKLAMMLPYTNESGRFGDEEMKIVQRVAFDTAIGWNLDIVQAMMKISSGNHAVSSRQLVEYSDLPRSNVSRRLEDMVLIKVIDRIVNNKSKRNEDRVTYVLNARIRELWRRAKVQEDHIRRIAIVSRGRKVKVRRIRKIGK